MQFECGTRILRVIHGWDTRATPSNRTTIMSDEDFNLGSEKLLSLQMWAKAPRKPKQDRERLRANYAGPALFMKAVSEQSAERTTDSSPAL